jgi:hypothetical protein
MTYKGIGDMANQSHGKRSGDVAVSRSIGETLFWDTRLKGWERRGEQEQEVLQRINMPTFSK